MEKVKKNRNYARVNEKALKLNITTIINEMKNKIKEDSQEKEKENSMLNKKRSNTYTNNEGNIINILTR